MPKTDGLVDTALVKDDPFYFFVPKVMRDEMDQVAGDESLSTSAYVRAVVIRDLRERGLACWNQPTSVEESPASDVASATGT